MQNHTMFHFSEKKKRTGSSKHNMIFNSTAINKKGSFKEEQKGPNGIQKKNRVSYYSTKIKTETSKINKSSEKIISDHIRTPTKRSIDMNMISENWSCLPAKKRLKLNYNSFALCNELEDESVRKDDEEEDIIISASRRNDSLVAEKQAIVRRKLIIFDESSDEEPEEMDGEDRLDEVTKEEIKGAEEMDELVADHQALLRRKFSSIKDELDEELETDDEPIEEAIRKAREMDALVAEHQALLRRTMGLLHNRIENEIKSSCDVPVGFDCEPQHWKSMTAEQKKRANELATLKTRTENPAFLRVLNRSCHTNKSCIAVPRSFAAEHLPEQTRTVVLRRPEFKGCAWSIRYYFRQSNRTIEGTAWVKFARENGLREGDVCMFELVQSANEVTFVVHISRTA